ncbi:MAG: HEAT repeat domain-containing protein, partial [Planctomycetota bacterium]
ATDQDVLAAMSDADAQVRAAAVTIAARAPGSTLVVAGATAFDRASPDGRVALLQFFGRRRDPAALPTVYKALRDAEAPVRLAAIPVAAALGREQALRPLVDVLKTPQPEEVRAAKEALIALPAGDLTLGLIQLAHGAQPARAVLLDIIAARPSAQDTQMLLPFTRDADVNVRLASLRALGALAGEKDVTTLLGLVQESDDEELTEAGKALAAAVRRAADRERAVEPVIAALPNATPLHEAALLEVLGRIGGAAALKAVQTALARDDAEARAAALRAFGEWPDDEPAADVLAAARQAGDEREHALALRAYIRMIGLVKDRPAAEALKMCAAALEAARRPDEKKLVFAHLGQIEDPAALALLAPHVQDAALSAEAGAAVLQLADPLSTSAAPQLRTLLEQLARAGPEALRARAAEALAEIRKRAGFITDWWVAGPFEQPGADAAALHAAAFPPERRLEDAQWRKQPVGEGRRAAWLIDLNATMRGDNRAGYLFTRVYSPRAQAARLELGSDDSIKAWLNGALVDDNPAIRGAAPAQDVVETQLKEGWNTLLLKVVNGGGGWAACARFVSLAGEPLDGVYAQSGDRP